MTKNAEIKPVKRGWLPGAALCLSLVALCFCTYNVLRAKDSSTACIDLVKVINASDEIKALNKEFEIKEKDLERQGDTIVNEFQREIKTFEKNISKMNEADKQEFSKKMNQKQSQFMNYKEINSKKISEQKSQATQRILSRVNTLAKDIALKNGFKIILGATGSGNVIYLDGAVDITEQIIKKINE